MNLGYRARKRLSRIVDNNASDVRTQLEDEHGDALAAIASNAVHDRLVQDDDLEQLVALAHGAEQIATDRDQDEPVGAKTEDAWYSIEDALDKRVEEVREQAVEDTLERETEWCADCQRFRVSCVHTDGDGK